MAGSIILKMNRFLTLKALIRKLRKEVWNRPYPELKFPGNWIESREEGLFAIPLFLVDEFNYTLPKADTKGAVSYYRSRYFYALRKLVSRFFSHGSEWGRALEGTLYLTRSGRLGGYLSVSASDATHKWASLVWNYLYSGLPVPDIPVRLNINFLNEKLLSQIIRDNYLLYGDFFAINSIYEFLTSEGFEVSLQPLSHLPSIPPSPAGYCIVKKSPSVDRLVSEIATNLFPIVREVSREMDSFISSQQKREEAWKMAKRQLRSLKKDEKPWQQDYLLVSRSKDIVSVLRSKLERVLQSPIPERIETRLPCDAVLFFKAVPVAAFYRTTKERFSFEKESFLRTLFPRAEIFAFWKIPETESFLIKNSAGEIF